MRRLDGGRRSFRDILAQEFFEPLGMKETALGRRKDLAARFVPIVVRDRTPGVFQPELLEAMNLLLTAEAEIPAGGVVSTAADILRWAEMLRRGGELDGVRVLSPASIRLAATIHTGTLPNNLFSYAYEARGWGEFPANLGLTFFIRGTGIFPHPFGTHGVALDVRRSRRWLDHVLDRSGAGFDVRVPDRRTARGVAQFRAASAAVGHGARFGRDETTHTSRGGLIARLWHDRSHGTVPSRSGRCIHTTSQ